MDFWGGMLPMIELSSVAVLEKGFLFCKDEIAQAWLFGVSKQKRRRWKNFMATLRIMHSNVNLVKCQHLNIKRLDCIEGREISVKSEVIYVLELL